MKHDCQKTANSGHHVGSVHSVAFELTSACTRKCAYCYNAGRSAGGSRRGEMTCAVWLDLIDRIIDEAAPEHVTLTGGEPLLSDSFWPIIERCGHRGVPLGVISNADLVDRAVAKRLAACRVQYVQVTLMAPAPLLHDSLCGSGSFERTLAGARLLAEAGVKVGGSFLCSRLNFEQAGDTYALLRGASFSHFVFNRFNAAGYGLRRIRELMPTRSQVLAALEQTERFAARTDTQVYSTMPIPPCMIDERAFPHIRFGQCSAGTCKAQYAVTPRGRLKLCPVHGQTIGDLRRKSIRELVAGKDVRRFRRAIPSFCRDCARGSDCLGGCGAAAQWVFGRASALDPFIAQHVEPGFRRRMAAGFSE